MTTAVKQVNSTLAEEALEKLELKFMSMAGLDAMTLHQVKEGFKLLDEAEDMVRHIERLPAELRNRALLVRTGAKLMMNKFRRP